MALLAHLSSRQLGRKIKSLTGLSTSAYIREARFTVARRQLEAGQVQTVKEAAYNVGLKDLQTFTQQFKKRFGKLPSEYL